MTHSQMLINYVPGEECRVAIVEDGKLEELHVERFAQASRVGNIYVGKVVNVEPAIQAAFIDFGVGDNGFLHVTDLHPKYFPGEGDETTERVGFKTPRRERPPIQAALRRGDEVIVQVLKEGVGTKGPTVTSYLSIPGRFLVMMPGMDKVGVSRKVEDEDERRKMREILDQLDLPEGFGFILRTAGFQRTKAELKRDLAYLQRLWKDMDRRLNTGGKARLLYSESDLLVRALRDVLSNEIEEVVIDHEMALKRASRFMKIVAPRGTTKLLHFPGAAPMFHAFGIEQQISLIHAREVPLPSGGRLVIDQTEALVAIDVNSGKSRDSRNSEDNAYQTNIEAVDEICRQLRLRDMGGIVINDLIDMRHASHRKDIENRVRERLKRDRAKTTISAISEFGILEMTRQRMRPSHESIHFSDCPTCRGRGMLQRPDSVAADALRELAAILAVERIAKVEMVVAPRVAGELLSTKRSLLGRVERSYSKHVDVRVSETVAVDRVTFYAYDAAGADVDLANLPAPRPPKDLTPWVDPDAPADWAVNEEEETAVLSEPEPEAEAEMVVHPIEIDEPEPAGGANAEGPAGEGGKRRRRRRRGGRGRGQQQTDQAGGPPAGQPEATPRMADAESGESDRPHEPMPQDGQQGTRQDGEGGGRRRRRRRRGRGGGGGGGGQHGGQHADQQGGPQHDPHRGPPSHMEPKPRRDSSPATGGEWGDDGPVFSQTPHAAEHTPKDAAPAHSEDEPREPMPARAELDARNDTDFDGTEDGPDEGGPEDAAMDGPQTAGGPAGNPDGHSANATGGHSGGDGQPGEGGERKRRRRRRRGRGRGGQGGPPGDGGGRDNAAPQGEPRRQQDRPQPQQRPPQQPRGGGYSNPQRSSRPTPPPAPVNAPPPPAAAPKIRTLYGGVKRRLGPGELNKRPKPE